MVISRDLLILISNPLSSKSWAPTSPLLSSLLPLIPKKIWVSSFLSWSWLLKTWRSISLSKFKFWMIKMWEEDSEHQTINLRQEWSHLFVPCPWDWMKAGIKFNSTCLISPEELMVQTILKPWESRSMPTAELEEYTSLIDCTLKKNFLLSSSYTCPSPIWKATNLN